MRKSQNQGFSLVEVVLALGIVAFAFVAILGLIPAGMSSFRQAINISVCSQIGQRVIGDCFQADYDTLLTPLGSNQGDSSIPFLMNYRYFDEEGNEVLASPRPIISTSNNAPSEPFIYLVVTRVTPYIALPGLQTNATTNAPSGFSAQTAAITVQVVFDPGQYIPNSGDFYGSGSNNGAGTNSQFLLNSTKIPASNIFTYYAHITRN